VRHFCYFNLHKFVFSVRNQQTRLVEHHSSTVVLNNCKLKVSQAGRERVLKEKRKNVHAGVEGELGGFDISGYDLSGFTELTYNPYKYNSFVIKENGNPVANAEIIVLINKKIYAKGIV